MASSSQAMTLLKLPAEIRNQIYAFVIPNTRLCTRKHCLTNPMARQYCLHCADRLEHDFPRKTPSVMYVCKAMYEDCSTIFYSKATLEIAPLRLPGRLTSNLSGSAEENYLLLSCALDVEYRFVPAVFRTMIHTAYVWTHDGTGISKETFRALLKWILRNLNPQEIQISAPVTDYLGKRRKHRGPPHFLRHQAETVAEIRAICDQEIWAAHATVQPDSGKLELGHTYTTHIPRVHVLERVVKDVS